MTYCIIPDVHGRTFWKTAKENINDYKSIIFLGDYVDPYVEYDGISKEDALANFEDIIDFAKENKDKVTLLLGNHDLHYFPEISVEYGCRRDNKRYKDIQTLFIENLDLFKVCKVIDTDLFGKVLLTHAGINKNYLETLEKKNAITSDNFEEAINSWKDTPNDIKEYLWRIGFMRGGYDKTGSLVWSDLDEHSEDGTGLVNEKLGVNFQIFAHTYAFPSPDEIFACSNYAMIDNKKIFEIR